MQSPSCCCLGQSSSSRCHLLTPVGAVCSHYARHVQVGEFKTPLRDGWGITVDDEGLMVLSDGSDTLTWVDPEDGFKRVRSLEVRDGTRRVPLLNEVCGWCMAGVGGKDGWSAQL
jgi:glutamine cyclotransferase